MKWMDSELSLLADRHGSDKGFRVLNAHGYTRVYEALLAPARHAPLRILELGLLHPALHGKPQPYAQAPSLQMWLDYLPQAQIFGADIEDFSGFAHPRCRILRVDVSDRVAVAKLLSELAGEFDLIIDDASHASHHQQIALGMFFSKLRVGGIYVIEDLHYQPTALEQQGILKTRQVLQALAMGQAYPTHASILTPTPLTALLPSEWQELQQHMAALQFFDSLDAHRLHPQECADALAVIVKK